MVYMSWMRLRMFQSLFFWMMPTGPHIYLNSRKLINRFQSLFFWMMPTGIFSANNTFIKTQSFNPCSSGWCLPADTQDRWVCWCNCFNPCSSGWCLPAGEKISCCVWGGRVSILVLLDDAYRPRNGEMLNWRLESFNPCSSGWCLPAPLSKSESLWSLRFQSLFFWMMPTGAVSLLICWLF